MCHWTDWMAIEVDMVMKGGNELNSVLISTISSHIERAYWCGPDSIQDSNNRHYSPHGYHACLLRYTEYSTTLMDITPVYGSLAFTLNHLPSYFKFEKNPEAILSLNASNSVFHYYGNTQSKIVEYGLTSGLPDFVRLMPNLKHIDISNISSAGLVFIIFLHFLRASCILIILCPETCNYLES